MLREVSVNGSELVLLLLLLLLQLFSMLISFKSRIFWEEVPMRDEIRFGGKMGFSSHLSIETDGMSMARP